MVEEEWKKDLTYDVECRIFKEEKIFGPGIARLMELVQQCHSLSEACREMDMAYSKGWKILKRAEGKLGFKLMEGYAGGKNGGSMQLTNEGEELLKSYQGFQGVVARDAKRAYAEFFEQEIQHPFVIVRGGGDLATGVIYALWQAGIPLLVLESEKPSAIRRQVSICEAVYEGTTTVEGMEGVLLGQMPTYAQLSQLNEKGKVPVLVSEDGKAIEVLQPKIVVDAILAKKNLGTTKDMAPFTIALGPGFEAGKDVDLVIETMRGHNLGRQIMKGHALPDTGIPGKIQGVDRERVIHASAKGIIHPQKKIADFVKKGDVLAVIEDENGNPIQEVYATISGLLRGMIRDGFHVTPGFKIADIDPREEEYSNCFTISDKARCIGGSVLAAVCQQLYTTKR